MHPNTHAFQHIILLHKYLTRMVDKSCNPASLCSINLQTARKSKSIPSNVITGFPNIIILIKGHEKLNLTNAPLDKLSLIRYYSNLFSGKINHMQT